MCFDFSSAVYEFRSEILVFSFFQLFLRIELLHLSSNIYLPNTIVVEII